MKQPSNLDRSRTHTARSMWATMFPISPPLKKCFGGQYLLRVIMITITFYWPVCFVARNVVMNLEPATTWLIKHGQNMHTRVQCWHVESGDVPRITEQNHMKAYTRWWRNLSRENGHNRIFMRMPYMARDCRSSSACLCTGNWHNNIVWFRYCLIHKMTTINDTYILNKVSCVME